jgi:putative transposase
MKYTFIDREKVQYPVVVQCRVLGVHRSGYYAWSRRQRTGECGKRAQENMILVRQIEQIHTESDARYGSPRVTAMLRKRGFGCSRGRVARLMNANRIKARVRRSYRITTRSNHWLASPNLLERQFNSATDLNRIWTSDITYVSTHEGWLYVAVVLDLFSRKVVGLSMGRELSKGLVCDALRQAIKRRDPRPGLLLHSDRGTQYSSNEYRQIIRERAMRQSMSAKGDCYDNAPTESFFKTLKVEETDRRIFKTRSEAAQAIFHFIEVFYNRQRLHSTLGYLSPKDFETLHNVNQQHTALTTMASV